MPELFACDTNVYIRAQRDRGAREALDRFRFRAGPRVRLLSLVAMELRAGARTPEQRDDVAVFIDAHERRGFLVAPGTTAYVEAGRVLADLAIKDRFEVARAAAAFTLDVLIAVTCRELDATLVTWNHDDFARIARHLRRFRIVGLSAIA
jgi:predicted nucleic acid-binding protein